MWQIILNDLKALIAKIEPMLEAVGKEFWSVVQAVFTAEESVVMAELAGMLKDDAVSLQNAQPGISSKDMMGLLEANAMTHLAKLGVELPFTAIVTVIGTIMHDLSVPDNTGNAGVVS